MTRANNISSSSSRKLRERADLLDKEARSLKRQADRIDRKRDERDYCRSQGIDHTLHCLSHDSGGGFCDCDYSARKAIALANRPRVILP